jgi:cytochrome P450
LGPPAPRHRGRAAHIRPGPAGTFGRVDALLGAGEVDLIGTVAEPLSVEVIAELLGVPDADRPHLRPWSADICRMCELHPTAEDRRLSVAASVGFSDCCRALCPRPPRRANRRLISELALVVDEGERSPRTS